MKNLKDSMTAVFAETMKQIIKNPIGVAVDDRNIVKGMVNGLYVEVERYVNTEGVIPHYVYAFRDIYGLPLYSIPMSEFDAEDRQHSNFASFFRTTHKVCNDVIRKKHAENLGLFNEYESDVIENHYK